MKHLIITGVGSRETPTSILIEMTKIGEWIKKSDYRLRSGHCEGADLAFEAGAREATDSYMPWATFNGNINNGETRLFLKEPFLSQAMKMAEMTHPAWDRCTPAAKSLHARNCCQVLGINLDLPSDYLVCWTPGGRVQGGTATAIRLAVRNKVHVINMGLLQFNTAEKVIAYIEEREFRKNKRKMEL